MTMTIAPALVQDITLRGSGLDQATVDALVGIVEALPFDFAITVHERPAR